MNATTLPAEIVAFAAAVRASLADLPADEVEELTDGLEADLAEAYAEDLARELPDPAAYAGELRAAAGLPTPTPQRGPVGRLAAQVSELGADVRRSLHGNPVTAAVMDYLVMLRPAWWIVRAWAAFQCFGALFGFEGDLFPANVVQWLLLLVLIAGSVALGQRTWTGWRNSLIGSGNAIAVVVLLLALPALPTRADVYGAMDESETFYSGGYVDEDPADLTGVRLNGEEVTNIFAYNARGEALHGVQLFDQDGNPLATSVPGGNGCLVKVENEEYDECRTPGAWVPTQLETGAVAWNVYPMKMAESTFEEPTKPLPDAVAQERPAPFVKVAALMAAVVQDAQKAVESKKTEKAEKSAPREQ